MGECDHYPVIALRKRRQKAFCPHLKILWPSFTHIVVTSQTTVDFWDGPWDKKVIAIGEKTAFALRRKGIDPLIAPFSTQEGIIELVKTIPRGCFFYPKSQRARKTLQTFFRKKTIPFFALDLYETISWKKGPLPNLQSYDKVFFTSPSTVRGFFDAFGFLPEREKTLAIGPITREALDRMLRGI